MNTTDITEKTERDTPLIGSDEDDCCCCCCCETEAECLVEGAGA
jgi:hypothetical protein